MCLIYRRLHMPSFFHTLLSRRTPLISLSIACGLAWCGASLAQTTTLLRKPTVPDNTVAVITVTQELIETTVPETFCWQNIISDRERARQQYQHQSWLVKHWQPIVGGLLGAGVAYQFTGNYGVKSQRWVYPTVASGVMVGAVAGPGAVAGSYSLGSLAHHFWPTKLPVTIALSIVGGLLGDELMQLLFPADPATDLMAEPQPGQYLPDQQFFLETTCMPRERVLYSETPYRVTYRYRGETREALMKYYPGDRIELDYNGVPVNVWIPENKRPGAIRITQHSLLPD